MATLRELREMARHFGFRLLKDARGYRIIGSYDYRCPSARCVELLLYRIGATGNV
jgi:hypothetical protein